MLYLLLCFCLGYRVTSQSDEAGETKSTIVPYRTKVNSTLGALDSFRDFCNYLLADHKPPTVFMPSDPIRGRWFLHRKSTLDIYDRERYNLPTL